MTKPFDRRDLMLSALAVVPLLATSGARAGGAAPRRDGARGPERAFDFFLGDWKVHHRRLKHQLAGSND